MNSHMLVGSLLMAASLLVPAALPLSAFPSASVSANTLVKASGPAVYYVAGDNKRYVFPNQRVYETWYRDFSKVETITDADLASLPIGGTVFYRPGTRLVKITSDPKVYAVGPNGALHPIASEAAALRLYGANWSQKVDDLSDAFFSNYRVVGSLDGTSHPVGTFFRYTENISYYVLDVDDDVVVARQIPPELISRFGLTQSNALPLRSTDFPYPIAATVTEADAARFYTVRLDAPTSPTPSDPGDSNGDGDGTDEPTQSPAKLGFAPWSGITTSQKVVNGDDQARLYAFTITGDLSQTVTIANLTMQVYIDAGGNNSDFSLGADSDDPIAWSVNQLMNNFTLRDMDTGETFGEQSVITPNGLVRFTKPITIAAAGKRNLALTARVQTTVAGVRLSAGLNPTTDVVLQTGSPSTTITPTTTLNGGINPSSIVTISDYGSMVITSSSAIGDSFQPLNADVVPYSLIFTSTGEPFTVSSLTIGLGPDGRDIYGIETMSLRYAREDGVMETVNHSFVDTENNVFRFINLRMYIAKGATVTIPVTVHTKADPAVYSGSRIQLKFLTEDFSATTGYSDLEYTNDFFADVNRIQNKTNLAPLIILRQASVTVQSHPDTPKGTITRYSKLPVLSFTLSAKDKPVSIHRLTFKLETTDIDEDGLDNDFFERAAYRIPNTVIGFAGHHADIDERTIIAPQQVRYQFYDASANAFLDDSRGIETTLGDYGLFTLDFGSSPLQIPAGSSLSYDFDVDTTLMTPDDDKSLRVRMLGDSKGTGVSQANFVWSDGSAISTSGYLVSGLELQGSYVSVR